MSIRPPRYVRQKERGRADRAVCYIGGKRIALGVYGSPESFEKYRRLLTNEPNETNETTAEPLRRPRPDDTSVNEVLAAYIAHARIYYRKNEKPTGECNLVVECCRFIRPLFGQARAAEFGPLSLQAVRQSMIEADYSRKHINKNIDRIKRMFRWAAAEELIPASVPQALSMVAGLRKGRCNAREMPPVLPVDDAVVEKTLPFLPPVVFDMVMLARFTGMRPAEVCMMRPRDVDVTGDVWRYTPESHKTEHHGRERVVCIGARAQGVLRKYLERGPEICCFRPVDSEAKRLADREASRKTPRSCGNVRGSNRQTQPKRTPSVQYSVSAFRRAIHRACDKAGVPRWSPNQLRHAAATAIRRKYGLEAAQVVLGHASANVTQVYAERDASKAADVARAIG